MASVVVPVGMAVATWLVLLLLAGLVLRIDSFSLLNLVPLFVVGLMLWPLFVVEPWSDDAAARVLNWVETRRSVLLVTVPLAVVTALSVVPGPLAAILNLPFRVSGVLFGASLFYRERVGAGFAQLLLRFGQWYLELLWLYLISSGIVVLGRRLR